METKGKKLGPPDKLYFCQTDESLSVHHYAIDKPENKRILSIYPDANKQTLSNPRLMGASNNALKDEESISSLLQPEQKYSTISKDSLRRPLEYKSTSSTSQGSEAKKIRAGAPNSKNNASGRNPLIQNVISSSKAQARRSSVPEELLNHEIYHEAVSKPFVKTPTNIIHSSTPKSSAPNLTRPGEPKILRSTKIFSAFPRDQPITQSQKKTINEVQMTKPLEKPKPNARSDKKSDQFEMRSAREPTQREDQNTRKHPVNQTTTKQDNGSLPTQTPKKSFQPEQTQQNKSQFQMDESANDSFTLLTKACEMLIQSTFGNTPKQSYQTKPGSPNVNQTEPGKKPKSSQAFPTKPEMALSSLIDKMFNIQPKEKFSSRSNRIFELDSVKSSPTTRQAKAAPPEPVLNKEFPTKKRIPDDISELKSSQSKRQKQFNYSEKKPYFDNDDIMSSHRVPNQRIHEIYRAQADFVSPVDREERFSYSTPKYKSRPESRNSNRQEFSKPRTYYTDSEENNFTHSEYSDEVERFYYSDYTDESISPGEGDVKQPQKFRTIPREEQRPSHYSDRRKAYHPNYSQSEKFSRKRKESRGVHKNYFKKLYDYTSDKIKKIVSSKPEEQEYFVPKRNERNLNQTQEVQTTHQESQKHSQEVQTSKYRLKQQISQADEASSVRSRSKRMKDNNEVLSSKSAALQIKAVESQLQLPEKSESANAVKNTQTESTNPTKVGKHTIIYEDKFTSTDTDDKSYMEPSESVKPKSTEIQTQTQEDEDIKQNNKQTKKTSGNRTKSPARSIKSQKVPLVRSENGAELSSDESESISSDEDSSHDHAYEQLDGKHPNYKGAKDVKEKWSSTRDKYLKKLYQYFPTSTKKEVRNRPVHGLPKKRKNRRHENSVEEEGARQKGKKRAHKSVRSDASEGWQSDQNSTEGSDSENAEQYSYFSDSNLSDQSASRAQDKKTQKRSRNHRRPFTDDEILSHSKEIRRARKRTKTKSNNTSKNTSQNTVNKTSAYESSAEEAESRKAQSEKDKKSLFTVEDDSELNRSDQDRKSAGKANKKLFRSANNQREKKSSNKSQPPFPSEKKTFSNARNSSSESLITNSQSNQNISLSEADTVRASKVESMETREGLFEEATERKDESFVSSRPPTGSLMTKTVASPNDKYDNNLKSFNAFLSSQQIQDKNPSPKDKEFTFNSPNALKEPSLQPLTENGTNFTNASFNTAVSSMEETRPVALEKEPIQSKQDAVFQSTKSNAVNPLKDNVSPKENMNNSNDRAPFRIPLSETYLPEIDKISKRQLDREALLTKSFQRQYTDSELSVLTASQKFSGAPIPNVSNDNYASALYQPNIRRYHQINSDALERSTNQTQNDPRTQPAEAFSIKQNKPSFSKNNYAQTQQQFQPFYSTNQNQAFSPSQNFHSAQETGYKDLREKLLSERVFENRIKNLYQNLPGNLSLDIQNAGSLASSLKQNKAPSNELNKSSTIESLPRSANTIKRPEANAPSQSHTSSKSQATQYSTTGPQAYSPGVSKIGPQTKSHNFSSQRSSRVAPQSFNSVQSRVTSPAYSSAISRVQPPFVTPNQSKPGSQVYSPGLSRLGPPPFKANQTKTNSQNFTLNVARNATLPPTPDQSKSGAQSLSSGLTIPGTQPRAFKREVARSQPNPSPQSASATDPSVQTPATSSNEVSSSQPEAKEKNKDQIYAGLSI